MRELVKVNLENEMDLILAHRRSMKLSELCGLSLSAQTIFATAISEIGRCAIEKGKNAFLLLGIDILRGNKKNISGWVCDSSMFCNEKSEHFVYAKRLIKEVTIEKNDQKFMVILNYKVPFPGTISEDKINSFIEYFSSEPPLSAYDELRRKNLQLQILAEKLMESENDYRQLTNKLPLMMFSVNTNGEVSYTNQWLQDFLGSSLTLMTKLSWQTFVHPDDLRDITQEWEKSQLNNTTFKIQGRLKHKATNNYLWHLISLVPIKSETQVLTKWIGFFVDINAEKVVEQTLKDNVELKLVKRELESKVSELNRSNDELEQFAYIASHDLQEPLRKIQTFSDYIQKNINNPAALKKYFERINIAAERMSVLINNVLEYSHISKYRDQFQQTDLNEILMNVLSDLELLISEKQAIIQNDHFPTISGIPMQLQQLFSNLIFNSLKFCDKKPVIEISWKEYPDGNEKLLSTLKTSKKYVHLIFKDNGIGFDQQYAEQIFVIFQRLNHRQAYEGTGIGLALCKKIVENHHGVITALGEPEKGATFNVYLPY